LGGALDDFQFINAGKSEQQLKDNISKDFLEPIDSRVTPVQNFLKLPHATVQGRTNYIGNTTAAALNTPNKSQINVNTRFICERKFPVYPSLYRSTYLNCTLGYQHSSSYKQG
jgi:hypothetical protein